jgi:hypothetical protein
MKEGYGNIRIRNAEISNIAISHNTEVVDSSLFNNNKIATLRPNVIYNKGECEEKIPTNMTIKLKGKQYSHEVINNMWTELKTNGMGIYKKANYDPTIYN